MHGDDTYGNNHHSQWRKDCRVCSPEVFDKFFLLAVPEGEISEVEMQNFVDSLSNSVTVRNRIQAAKASGKARRLLERLEDFTKELPLENVPHLVSVLFNEGDALRFESLGVLDITANMQVARIIYQCVSRFPSEQERHELLLGNVKNGAGLYTLVQQVSLSEPKEEKNGKPLLSSRELWEQLRDAAVARIQTAQASGELWNTKHLPYVLFRWLEWTSTTVVQATVSQYVADDANLLKFLATFVDQLQSHTAGDMVGRKYLKINKEWIASFLQLEDVSVRLSAITEQGGEAADSARSLIAMLEKSSEAPWDD